MATVGTDTIREANRQRIANYFASGAQPINGPGKLGVEVEHFLVSNDGRPVSYEPTQDLLGVRDVLEHLRTWYPECTYNNAGDLLGLAGEEGTVTLEPAAQLELSAAPYTRVADIERAYTNFRTRVDDFLARHSARLVTAGYHPTRTAQQLTLIPKRRYDFMNDYFAHIHSNGDRMMRASASTQVSIDFADEADAVQKMRVSAALAPVLAAIADNTRVYEGEANHTPIRRLQLWREVDAARCGTIPGIFRSCFGFLAYTDWLLDTSPIFVTRPPANEPTADALRAAYKVPAGDLYADALMDDADIEHLASMFWPDVRLKRFVEIRPADCMPLPQILGYAALVKGLFYSSEALKAIEGALGVENNVWPLTTGDVDNAIAQVQRHGFLGNVYGRPLKEWEDLLFSLARRALPAYERHHLAALEHFARNKPWWNVQ